VEYTWLKSGKKISTKEVSIMNAQIKSHFNSLRAELVSAIDSGAFDELPADVMNITPLTRLEWAVDSVDYIVGVGDSIADADKEIAAVLKNKSCFDNDYVLVICGVIEALSKDQYVTEGRGNIELALELLKTKKPDADVKRSTPKKPVETAATEDSDEENTGGSVWDKMKGFLFKNIGRKDDEAPAKETVVVPDVKLEKPESLEAEQQKSDYAKLQKACVELKKAYAKLEAEKAKSDARAKAAEKEAELLKADVRRLKKQLNDVYQELSKSQE
jgi:hypothetical protein